MIATTLPHNSEAERAVLGACILSPEALGVAVELLKPEDFYDSSNRTLYKVLMQLSISDKPADIITISDLLKAEGMFDRLGGQPFLAELINEVTTTANIIYHAEIVREYSIRRKLFNAGNKIIALSLNLGLSIRQIIDEAEKLIFEASQNRSASDFEHVRELIGPVFAKIEESFRKTNSEVSGYPTGFADLDSYTGGFQPGSLNIIAARPSMGKTAFALNMAQFGGGDANQPVLIFSLEMSSDQLVKRMLAAESGINLSQLLAGTFDTSAFDVVKEACDVLARRNIFINDSSDITIMDFRTKCRRFKTRYSEIGLIIVDYLQLMTTGNRNEGRQQEVADISRLLKITARDLECPVVALSQLSRAAEQRQEKKPQLSDLRDSGAIEQDADVVMLMFREDYYTENENNDIQDSKADIRIAKNRNGSTGVFHLTFKREITRFFNYGEG